MTLGRTLRREVDIDGLGLHSGAKVSVRVRPGDSGLRFRRGNSVFDAVPENVTDTTRCTRLGEISTIEHIMSAFAALEITDAEIEVSAPELPALDGSAAPFFVALAEAGFEPLSPLEQPALFSRIFVQEEGWSIAISKGSGQWSYTFATGARWPHEMNFQAADVIRDFPEQIAPARTFAFSEEVPRLLSAGLGRGLDEHSALILGEDGYDTAPRFSDEPARHKLLDLMGDLYLAGVPLSRLNVVAERSGHAGNVRAANLLRQAVGQAQRPN